MDGIIGEMMFFLDQKKLQEGIKELNLSVSEKQLQMLDKYSELLFKWNKTYNLTAITDKDDVLTHHILDSLSVVNVFKNYLAPNGSMLDVGSGGGLPAIPIAVMLPNCKVSMVETVGKKAAFLRQVTLNLKLTNLNETVVKCGFPVSKLSYYSHLLNLNNITYEIINPNEPLVINNTTSYEPIIKEILSIDFNELTFKDAFFKLQDFQNKLKKHIP